VPESLGTPWRSEILSNRADSFFYSFVGVWSSVIELSPHKNRTLCFWGDILINTNNHVFNILSIGNVPCQSSLLAISKKKWKIWNKNWSFILTVYKIYQRAKRSPKWYGIWTFCKILNNLGFSNHDFQNLVDSLL
jgi:hypothetical protein